jgi:hypothetical protein
MSGVCAPVRNCIVAELPEWMQPLMYLAGCADEASRAAASLDEGLLSLSLYNLRYMENNPYRKINDSDE